MCWVFTFFSLANRTRLYLLFVATKVVATRVMLFFLLRLKLLQLELSTYLTIMEFCKSDRLLWKVGLQIVINGDEIMLTILLADVFISGMFYKIQFFPRFGKEVALLMLCSHYQGCVEIDGSASFFHKHRYIW